MIAELLAVDDAGTIEMLYRYMVSRHTNTFTVETYDHDGKAGLKVDRATVDFEKFRQLQDRAYGFIDGIKAGVQASRPYIEQRGA